MSHIGLIGLMSLFLINLCPTPLLGQIKIGGNVYGGGNHAEVQGSTRVTVLKGDIGAVMDPNATRPLADPSGKVFGGARMANVGGSSFVNIDGENATGYILINQVFGGNDIAGTIGTAGAVGEEIPTELTETQPESGTNEKKNKVDNTFNSYVRISTKALNETYDASEVSTTDPENPAYGKTAGVDVKPDPTAKKIYIGQLFGGGNGDFDYEQTPGPGEGKVTHTIYNWSDDNHEHPIAQVVTDEGEVGFQLPEQDKTYLEIKGGSIVYGYGGGNNATVKKQNIIHIDNPSAVVNHILVDKDGKEPEASQAEAVYTAYATYVANKANGVEQSEWSTGTYAGYTDLLTTARFKEMGINTTFSQPSSGAYQVGRFFGGNNKAEMSIRPTWNLLAGKVRNLYSGGNRGNMTSPEGLLLEIKDYSTLIVDNLYGGCRMADVKPTVNGKYVPCTNLEGYYFPNELSARVLVDGGHINNVYGGNDVTGTVYGGNAVGIHTTVYGDVYGGGNGAYPYTDNTDDYLNDDTYGDFCFEGGNAPMESLKAFRPNAEQVSLHLWGESPTKPTVIHGSVFVGGNCASLAVKKSQPLVELKIGSHVIADNVYLGNNGEGMINQTYLKKYSEGFSSWDLKGDVTFGQYMDGVAMTLMPKIVFDRKAGTDADADAGGDRNDYEEYSSYIGSFFCGGNVGSMAIPGKMTFNVDHGLNIYNKFVGGCNNADIPAGTYNAAYNGGIIGSEEERDNYTDASGNIMDRLEINFRNMTVVPRRWNDTFEKVSESTKLKAGKEYYHTNLQDSKFIATGEEIADATHIYYEKTKVGKDFKDFEWNTAKWDTNVDDFMRADNIVIPPGATDEQKKELIEGVRLINGNVYGGCYNSGHVNGNVVININDDVLKKDEIFGEGTSTFYGYPKSGVDFESQRDDVMTSALYVYGAGHGEKTEIWGSTTINHNKGYAFQLFGGGEQGAVGKKDGSGEYTFDKRYSTTVNLNGTTPIYSHDGTVENLAEAEYLYGGGNEGIIAGNTLVNLGNGRIYDAFGGSSDADILGHTEVFVGRQPNGSGGYKDGFPWLRDNVYGGNDFGGTIHGAYEDGFDFTSRVRDYETDKTQIHGYKADEIPEVLKSSSYVEYLQGRVDSIFGGGYGSYNYANTELYGTGCSMPKQESAFVNIRPKDHAQNYILGVYGAGTGYPGVREDDVAQDRSYVLVDIPDGMTNFGNTEVFGAGSYNGIGMKYTPAETFAENFNLDKASAVIDLLRGRIHNAYGGSYQEGNTRRTVVNVPKESSIQIDNIFGGAYGVYILPPCDVYETQVNYNNTSENAQVFGAIYGGNNNERRSLFTQVNISSPVYSNKEKGYTGTVYGAGRGIDTWSEHTEVNLLSGARVYNVYGGGEMGHVLNSASVQAYMNLFKENLSPQISQQDPFWSSTKDGAKYNIVDGNRVPATDALKERWRKDWANAWRIGDYYNPIVEGKDNDGNASSYDYTKYATNTHTSLAHFANRSEIDDNTAKQLDGKKKHNTNVIVNKGAIVEGYAYGGGLGDASVAQTGDIYGSTYVAVLGGEVKKDVYAGGRAGGVDNLFGATDFDDKKNTFVATANAYIQGGTARNVYGGGYEGHVGHHAGDITTTTAGDRPAEAYVVIGKKGTDTFDGGAPAITRNVYGGGEGGSVYGTTNLTINNGYIGYRYKGFLAVPKDTELTEGATYYTSAKGDGKFTAKGTETSTGSNYYEETYVEELDDQKPGDLELSGNVFGGGYVANSYVDSTTINMYGGTVRGSLYGGGEIGPIGRGTMKSFATTPSWALKNQDATIFKAGTTNVNMFDGKVKRNVFGGGRGKDSWGGDGTMYMDPAVVATLDMKCKGYVFGQTHVNIHGGEIGTAEGMAYGYGNVFGGGDEGSVYSAYENASGALRIGKKPTGSKRYDKVDEGYYYRWNGTNYVDDKDATTSTKILTEDCKVVVEPWAPTYLGVTIGDSTFAAGAYVPTVYLNKLKGKNDDPRWSSLDTRGVIIHNAVFAGGNISSGSSTQNANDKTVFGNATASIHDAYNRDLITIGTGHTGGLYGDGNLTFVDGYRELNITNYGTDFYHIATELTYDDYLKLPEREQAYYELKYSVKEGQGPIVDPVNGTTYTDGSTLPQDEIIALFENTKYLDGGKPNPVYWQEQGVVSVYAGRIMNTIQRADLCGVFGSRMVMKGAQDRVPEEVDYTNYTINRVREVSLNKKASIAGDTDDENKEHGNYFGIYNVVNYLGALTSDVKFTDVRITNSDDSSIAGDGSTTYYQWKSDHITQKSRNNGTCHNHLALASGVYLELTSEEKTGKTLDTKEWGPITGVVELDLINVQPGIGGGFVYAKNVHGTPTYNKDAKATTLTTLNDGAATKKSWTYSTVETSEAQHRWETSGNFIHSSQRIIDDCYNISNKYMGDDKVPAHYWYIAGSVYVYDQYISAYTGSPNAYSEMVEIPITISAASHGAMTLLDVQPNYYAYYKSYTNETTNVPLSGEQKLVIGDVIYQLNDPISYWDYSKLPAAEKRLFVNDTYVTSAGCKIGNDTIYAGTVMIPGATNKPGTYEAYKAAASTKTIDEKAVKVVTSNGKEVPFDEIFHSSNNLSHDTGYLLTYNVTNPKIWDKWYTPVNGGDKNQTGGAGYEDGPTYSLKIATGGKLLGQQDYEVNAIIPEKTYLDYQALTNKPTDDQAEFTEAYLVTKECTSNNQHYYPGAPVSAEISGCTAPAYVSTATIQLSPTEYIYVNDLMTQTQIADYKKDYPSLETDIDAVVKPAYICTTAGKYGGSYYEAGKNYRGLEAYSAMSPEDREHFKFNYDALDLLIDPNYSYNDNRTQRLHDAGKLYQYDSEAATLAGAEANDAGYSLTKPIDYKASYDGNTTLTLASKVEVKRGTSTISTDEIVKNDTLLNTVYESLPNEQHYYAPIAVKASGTATTCYVVKETFVHANIPYAAGSTIAKETFERLSDSEKSDYIDQLVFASSGTDQTYYYCREDYDINSSYYTGALTGAVTSINGVGKNTTYTASTEGGVPAGIVISSENYDNLVNKQKNFIIHGTAPTETSTLYVARNANINDLSSEKIITVIYKYDYEESDLDGTHITPVTERHVVNIHINFKSGVPTVEDINPPTIVLPGTGITMRVPSVTPGAYEITGGGWEIFEKPSDAESHINGVPYTPSVDPLYWYQDGFYLAYYAKTYLGKTYSNHVPVSVANYHDLKRVMDDKTTHLHVDYDRTRLKRDSKIYINDYSASSENGLDLFKNFYDLSILENPTVDSEGLIKSGDFIGHKPLNNSIEEITLSDGTKTTRGVWADANLEFILRTDIDHSTKPNPAYNPENPEIPERIPASWTTIGTDDICFKGNLHGDGHTISGLDNSLFYNLCGSVYNLGVTGTFTSAGVAEKDKEGKGYIENCWISTSNTAEKTSKPVFGNPTKSDYVQIVNSYYMEEDDAVNKYTNHSGDYGIPTRKPAKAFFNGEVAYDLNGFYLYKRYNDGVNTASGVDYKYYTLNASGNIPEPKTPLTGYYAKNEDLCSSGYNGIKYVEERFADGDFVFAAGEIPTAEDERFYSWTVKNPETNVETVKSSYFPIWPDDYIFFGQKLTYGWAAETHQNVPTAVVREDGRLSTSSNANRVYRAPAYYRSATMDMAHFNPHVYLAQKERLTTEQIEAHVTPREAYPNMTAIDFKGHYETKPAYGEYGLGNEKGLFYTPLLDDDGLLSIQNCDETQNLLVYAPAASGDGYVNAKTHGVLTSYFVDPVYESHHDNSKGYHLVSEASTGSVHGHLVQSNLEATNDHLLVDYQDFNAPIAYDFDGSHLMWYQRLPADKDYVDLTKGWQGISIPFTAELVTTDQKGEITHFYGSSYESYNGTKTKRGHEYWLREYKDIEESGDPTVAKATFNYPSATGTGKTVTNTFLWDYYYYNQNLHNQLDRNADKYEQDRQYYKDSRDYPGYSNLAAATPYIIGFPGSTYYEFDLSGKFVAQNTAVAIPQLEKQIISFVSNTGAHIRVSDDEMVGVNHGDYTFKTSYMNEALSNGDFVMNTEGSAYVKLDNTSAGKYHTIGSTYDDAAAFNAAKPLYTDEYGTEPAEFWANKTTMYYKRQSATPYDRNEEHHVTPSSTAFRPYFTAAAVSGNGSRSFFTKKIIFGGTDNDLREGPETVLDGSLEIYTRGYNIVTTSHMKEATVISIITAAGATFANYVLQPGETIETTVPNTGVYVVNKKKVFIE